MKRLGMLTADSVAMLMVSVGYSPDEITTIVQEAIETGEANPPGDVDQIRYSFNTKLFVMYIDTELPLGDDDMPPEVIG